MSDIKLNFINNSNDKNNSDVVIFQKNVATDYDELAIAWKVIENCGMNNNHPFTYPMEYKTEHNISFKNTPSRPPKNIQPKLNIGLTPKNTQLKEGETIHPNQLSDLICNSEFDLEGVKSGDIVMTGGEDTPVTFSLENVEKH